MVLFFYFIFCNGTGTDYLSHTEFFTYSGSVLKEEYAKYKGTKCVEEIIHTHKYNVSLLDEDMLLHEKYFQRRKVVDGWPVCLTREQPELMFEKLYERLPSAEYMGILLDFNKHSIQKNRMLGLLFKFLGRIQHPLVKLYMEVDTYAPFGFIMKDTNKLGMDIEVRVFFKRNVWKRDTMKDPTGYLYMNL